MAKAWQLQEAKNSLSEVVNEALSKGPQVITRRGEEVVVVLSMKDYTKMLEPENNLVDFFKKSPLYASDLSFERSRDLPRKVTL